MSSEIAISAQNLSKLYYVYKRPFDRLLQMIFRGKGKFANEYWALKNVTLDVFKGETFGIVGRNGSGKSTLLQLLYGTLSSTTGNLSVKGRVAALIELGAGFNPEFTGSENIYLSASILGLSNDEIKSRFQQIVDFAGIGDFINQPVKVYSSGMYARLAFAVAAHVDADILIIDEILSVGDAAFTQKCMRFIRQFKERGTILFVSHDTGSVVNLCDRCLWLEDGETRELGNAKEVCERYVAALQQEKDSPERFKIGGSRRSITFSEPVKDSRHELIKSSNLRNSIKVFDFDPDGEWFGRRAASIVKVEILNQDGMRFASVDGGETVVMRIEAQSHRELNGVIMGFYIKDRLGQRLFGDNTYLSYLDNPISIPADTAIEARFTFVMPYLAPGDYSVTPAIAEGSQSDHIQHHWIEDAIFFKVLSSHVHKGILGLPMIDISIRTLDA